MVPNTIDWSFVFANADFMKNPSLYITEIGIAVVYILLAIWARRKDIKDITEVSINHLSAGCGFIGLS